MSNAQKEIKISIKNVTADTIYYSQNIGKRLKSMGPAIKSFDNFFHLPSEKIEPGVYTFFYTREKIGTEVKRTQFFVDENNHTFTINVDGFLTNKASFVGSEENSKFNQYISKVDSTFEVLKKAKDNWIIYEDDTNFNLVAKAEQTLKNLDDTYLAIFTNPLLQSYVKSTKVNYPIYSGSLEEKKKQRQDFFDKEYLQKFDFTNPLVWQVERSIDLLDIFTIYSSDADYKKVESRTTTILNLLEKVNPAGYSYYLNYLLNSFPKMSKHNYDLVTCTLYDEYLVKGRAKDIGLEKTAKIKDSAEKIKKMAPGNTLTDITLYKQDKSPVSVHSITAPYTMLVIWSPDCGHCKKELPALKRVNEKYLSKNVKILTICGKKGDGGAACYEYLSNNQMNDWLNLNDDQNQSRYVSIYDATSYPMMILIDKDKKILIKRKGEITEAEFEKIYKNL